MKETILTNIREALGREAGQLPGQKPEIYPARQAGPVEGEIERFMAEIRLLSGRPDFFPGGEIGPRLSSLVASDEICKASVWETPLLKRLGVAERLLEYGVELVPPQAGKFALADCDLGVTEADYALPETGTLALHSSPDRPRAVSLVPRLHLAVLTPAALRADLHQVFEAAKSSNYLVFITGPSRTSDIELTVTLGVHGPKGLIVWMVTE